MATDITESERQVMLEESLRDENASLRSQLDEQSGVLCAQLNECQQERDTDHKYIAALGRLLDECQRDRDELDKSAAKLLEQASVHHLYGVRMEHERDAANARVAGLVKALKFYATDDVKAAACGILASVGGRPAHKALAKYRNAAGAKGDE